MGNIITTDTGNVKDSELGKIITDWALNDYDAGMSYGKTTKLKYLLKKRACCTGRQIMKIALPTINLSDDVTGTTELIEPGYTPVSFSIFSSNEDLQQNCKIERTQYALPEDFGIPGHRTEEHCSALYAEDGLCKQIENDRRKQTSDLYKIAYGYYPADQEFLNVYSDCNCENSTLRNKKKAFSSSFTFDENILAQKFDGRCTSQGDRAYKIENFETNMCINISNEQDLSADENSSINTNQSCSNVKNITDQESYANDDNGLGPAPPTTPAPATTPAPTTSTKRKSVPTPTTTQVPKPSNQSVINQVFNGIKISVTISVIILIIYFIFKKYNFLSFIS
jgi:hypothetical protein